MNAESTYLEWIVEDIFSKLNDKELEVIREIYRKEEMCQFHRTVGMQIRNDYGLWNEVHPLTRRWFKDVKNNTSRFIVDGVDYHPDHPDAVSAIILEMLWEKVNGGSVEDSN